MLHIGQYWWRYLLKSVKRTCKGLFPPIPSKWKDLNWWTPFGVLSQCYDKSTIYMRTGKTDFESDFAVRLMQQSIMFPREYSHKLGYAYTRTARVWFLPISDLERVRFWKLVLLRVGFFGDSASSPQGGKYSTLSTQSGPQMRNIPRGFALASTVPYLLRQALKWGTTSIKTYLSTVPSVWHINTGIRFE